MAKVKCKAKRVKGWIDGRGKVWPEDGLPVLPKWKPVWLTVTPRRVKK